MLVIDADITNHLWSSMLFLREMFDGGEHERCHIHVPQSPAVTKLRVSMPVELSNTESANWLDSVHFEVAKGDKEHELPQLSWKGWLYGNASLRVSAGLCPAEEANSL
jgi:hypothetical protein